MLTSHLHIMVTMGQYPMGYHPRVLFMVLRHILLLHKINDNRERH